MNTVVLTGQDGFSPYQARSFAITPPGVLRSDELDYTLHHPVTLQDVTIP